ncbi:hypothetical protein QAD02_001140 [Eretmocerus hayati]|uniref:Uncharacterized protein n=1 Tax=Eretmocerus hayati TaxID=131215 RepID=A0ACC2NGX9_9HYME|nr:hypothetical protein QAD02_001140 [Eretmocerus hayati]
MSRWFKILRMGRFLVFLAVTIGIFHKTLAGISNPHVLRDPERCVNEYLTSIKDYPYLVVIRSGDFPVCSGVIVSETQILTSNQCTTKWPIEPLTVKIGCSNPLEGGTIIKVTKVTSHGENYVSENGYTAALAILTLNSSILEDSFAKIADLNKQTEFIPEGTGALLVGWGSSPGVSSSFGYLGELKMQFVPNSECTDIYNSTMPLAMPEDLICASASIPLCQGDVGGPLIVGKRVVGILSWGDCFKPGYPQVFANISANIGWIEEERRNLNRNLIE